jgi:hypothetical protein
MSKLGRRRKKTMTFVLICVCIYIHDPFMWNRLVSLVCFFFVFFILATLCVCLVPNRTHTVIGNNKNSTAIECPIRYQYGWIIKFVYSNYLTKYSFYYIYRSIIWSNCLYSRSSVCIRKTFRWRCLR